MIFSYLKRTKFKEEENRGNYWKETLMWPSLGKTRIRRVKHLCGRPYRLLYGFIAKDNSFRFSGFSIYIFFNEHSLATWISFIDIISSFSMKNRLWAMASKCAHWFMNEIDDSLLNTIDHFVSETRIWQEFGDASGEVIDSYAIRSPSYWDTQLLRSSYIAFQQLENL